jgi:rhodanese-related sulfurtransferase
MGFLQRLFGKTQCERCTPLDLVALLREGASLIDVREPVEYRSGHIAGARNVPLSRLAGGAQDLPKDARIVVGCLSGHRSSVAIGHLRRLGFSNLVNLDGGFQAWKAAGLPVSK